MSVAISKTDEQVVDILAAWAQRQGKASPRRSTAATGTIRFGFYGRMSTVEHQDKQSSAWWQRRFAEELIFPHGRIVAEFFDVGHSRRRAWPDRPQAARLLALLAQPLRGFDAIVVGEFERAFGADQLDDIAPILQLHAVPLWLPETRGPIDFTNSRHVTLLDELAVRSGREVSRARIRTTASMHAQTVTQGRHLGGRPPYGYRLADAGPHPNRAHAKWGRRLLRLEPDPVAAATVRWMFAERLTGRSVASIARELNDNAIPCPSAIDPARNPHRHGDRWTLRTVSAILANPRYTGRQVWNRQRSGLQPDQPIDGINRQTEVRQWTSPQNWAISDDVAHPPLVSEASFVAAQSIRTVPTPASGSPRTYLLSKLVYCGRCGRALDAHWANKRPGFRCRHGYTSTRKPNPDRPKALYIREDHLFARLWTIGLHPAHHLDWLADVNQHQVADLLRHHNMIIMCGAQRSILVTATGVINF